MKKVLFADLLPMRAHKVLNKIFLSSLSKFTELYLVTEDEYFDQSEIQELDIRDTRLVDLSFFKRINHRVKSLYVLLTSLKFARSKEIKTFFFPTFDTITLAFISFFKKKDVFVLHHNNIDELENPIKRFFFNLYKKEICHFVFADFIKDYLVNVIGINGDRVYVIHHPIMKLDSNFFDSSPKRFCVGLSHSNDESLIQEIIEIEKAKKILEKNNYQLFIKSKNIQFDSRYLNVKNDYLSQKKFSELIAKSSSFLLLYSKEYKYRASGVLIDGLSNNKIVIGSDFKYLDCYYNLYPSICRIGKSTEELLRIIVDYSETERTLGDFSKFQADHSDEKFSSKLKRAFLS